MNLKNLKTYLNKRGCKRLLAKNLAPNDNSKNQVYLGGSFDVLNLLPIKEITAVSPGDWKRERFKATLSFSWISKDGKSYPSPNAQLILYPKYPEVRFSGFLLGCENAPSELMASRIEGRILLMGVDATGRVLGYVAGPNETIAKEFAKEKKSDVIGVFEIIDLVKGDSKSQLLSELRRIHQLDWIKSKKLEKDGSFGMCEASNCGGYTLEAELGIPPNGFSEPDFLGWEIKQFGVSNLDKIGSKAVTLMTPEPTDGVYTTSGVEHFIRTYGYADKKGRPNRINFGGVHKHGLKHKLTKLKLELHGYEPEENKIRSAGGRIALVDENGNIAASWSFSSMMLHWNRKHEQACYVPSLTRDVSGKQYKYGKKVILGEKTGFEYFLKQIYKGNVYYDPGIKLENENTDAKVKRRSQFRISSKNINQLYVTSEVIDVTK